MPKKNKNSNDDGYLWEIEDEWDDKKTKRSKNISGSVIVAIVSAIISAFATIMVANINALGPNPLRKEIKSTNEGS